MEVRGLKCGRRRLGESGRRVSVGWAEVGWWEEVEEAARRGKGVHGRREGVSVEIAPIHFEHCTRLAWFGNAAGKMRKLGCESKAATRL
jgi:hypothetical protein